jgi:hypothetical protein
VTFRIGRHSGFAVPADALELLLRRLGSQLDHVSFAMVGAEIRARTAQPLGDAMSREARIDLERRAIVDLICDVCDDAPELKSDWFAVSYVS